MNILQHFLTFKSSGVFLTCISMLKMMLKWCKLENALSEIFVTIVMILSIQNVILSIKDFVFDKMYSYNYIVI